MAKCVVGNHFEPSVLNSASKPVGHVGKPVGSVGKPVGPVDKPVGQPVGIFCSLIFALSFARHICAKSKGSKAYYVNYNVNVWCKFNKINRVISLTSQLNLQGMFFDNLDIYVQIVKILKY